MKSTKTSRFRKSVMCLSIGLIALTAVSCAPRIATRGNPLDPEVLADIEPGEMAKDEVAEILGAPSTVSMFNREKIETWYYISERTETIAFFASEVAKRNIVAISFNQADIIQRIDTIGLKDGKIVEHIARKTPTVGNELSIIDQVLGNLGRFNKGQ